MRAINGGSDLFQSTLVILGDSLGMNWPVGLFDREKNSDVNSGLEAAAIERGAISIVYGTSLNKKLRASKMRKNSFKSSVCRFEPVYRAGSDIEILILSRH